MKTAYIVQADNGKRPLVLSTKRAVAEWVHLNWGAVMTKSGSMVPGYSAMDGFWDDYQKEGTMTVFAAKKTGEKNVYGWETFEPTMAITITETQFWTQNDVRRLKE